MIWSWQVRLTVMWYECECVLPDLHSECECESNSLTQQERWVCSFRLTLRVWVHPSSLTHTHECECEFNSLTWQEKWVCSFRLTLRVWVCSFSLTHTQSVSASSTAWLDKRGECILSAWLTLRVWVQVQQLDLARQVSTISQTHTHECEFESMHSHLTCGKSNQLIQEYINF